MLLEVRYVWEQANGPIPHGLHVCHHCDTPRCIRLSHLFLGTPLENMQDKMRKGRWKGGRPRGTCNAGHPMEGDNLYVTPKGMRTCRTCQRRRKREHYQRKIDVRKLKRKAS